MINLRNFFSRAKSTGMSGSDTVFDKRNTNRRSQFTAKKRQENQLQPKGKKPPSRPEPFRSYGEMRLNAASLALSQRRRLNLDLFRPEKFEKVHFPTNDVYPYVTREPKGNLKLLRQTVNIRNRDVLRPQEKTASRSGKKVVSPLDRKQWSIWKKSLDSTSGSDAARKRGILDELARRALKGDQRSFATLINLTYHPDKLVRDHAIAKFPELYANNQRLAAALSTYAMSRFDPVLEADLLRERADDLATNLLLNGHDTLKCLSILDDKTLETTTLPKRKRFRFTARDRLLDEDLSIATRLKVLKKKQTTHPLIAMAALADGYDRRCAQAAHKILAKAGVTRKLQLPSLDLAVQFNRPITPREIRAHQVMNRGGPATFLGQWKVDDPNLVQLLANKIKDLSDHVFVATLSDSKGSAIGTIILQKGKAALIGLDWSTADYTERRRVSNKFTDDIQINSTEDARRQIALEEGANFLEDTLANNGIAINFSVHFTKFSLPDSPQEYRQDMFGLWMVDQLCNKPINIEELPIPSGIAREYADKFCKLTDQQRWNENVALRLKMMNGIIEN